MFMKNENMQYKEIAWKLFSIFRGRGEANIVSTIGFLLVLSKQNRLISYRAGANYGAINQLYFTERLSDDLDIKYAELLGVNNSDIDERLTTAAVDIILSIYDFDHAVLFDELIAMYASQSGKRGGEFLQPSEITHLVTHFIKESGAKNVYNPFAGIGSYQLDNKEVYYLSQELNRQAWIIGKIRMLLNDISVDYQCENSLYRWAGDNSKFDAVVATPPFGARIDNQQQHELSFNTKFHHNRYESWILEKGLKSINDKGCVICIMPTSFLFDSSKATVEFRRYLVENGYISKLILLPNNIFYFTGINTVIVELRKYHSNNIVMVDGTSLYTRKNNRSTLNWEELITAIRNIDSNFVKIVSNDDIPKVYYDISPSLYINGTLKDIEVPDGYKLEKLGTIITAYRGNRIAVDNIRVMKGKDLADGRFSFDRTFENVDLETLNQRLSLLDKDLLLMLRIGKLKPTLFHHNPGYKVCCNQNVFSFEINADLVDAKYLLNELGKEYVEKQVIARSNGAAMQSITMDSLLEVKVLIPESIDMQKIAYDSDKRNYALLQARELGLEEIIAQMKSEYLSEVSMRKHDMKPYLRELSSTAKLLKHLISIDNITDHIASIKDVINNQQIAIAKLNLLVDSLSDEEVFGVVERINLDKFFTELEINHPSTSRYDIIYDEDSISLMEYGFKRPPDDLDIEDIKKFLSSDISYYDLYVNIAYSDLQRLVSNITMNAELHGFIDNTRDDYEIRIDLSVDAEKKMFCIDFRNNGEPLPSGLTKERYGLKGEKAGVTGNTGVGGYRVKSIVKHYGGDYEIFCDKDSNMPVTVRIYLPIFENYE